MPAVVLREGQQWIEPIFYLSKSSSYVLLQLVPTVWYGNIVQPLSNIRVRPPTVAKYRHCGAACALPGARVTGGRAGVKHLMTTYVLKVIHNVWVVKKDTKHSSVLLLWLVSFFATQTLAGILLQKIIFSKVVFTIFPHIVAAATILFWKLKCGKYSREETIQGRKLLFYFTFCILAVWIMVAKIL